MPPILSKPSKAAHLAIGLVLLGSLIVVNTTVVYFYIVNHHKADSGNDGSIYWCAGFFFSGLTLFVIGLAVGSIGRAARKAEMPPAVSPGEHTAQPAVTAPVPAQTAPVNGVPAPPAPAVLPTAPVARVR